MSNNLTIDDFKDLIKGGYSQDGHRADHITNVYNYAIRIYNSISDPNHLNYPGVYITEYNQFSIDVDRDVVVASSILHDICRATEIEDHAIEGAIWARDYLHASGILPDEAQREKVYGAILTHRYSRGLKATSIEGEILQDADRLDSLGSNGIIRCLSYSIKHNIPIHDKNIKPVNFYNSESKSTTAINHLIEKQLSIKPESFHFEFSRNIAISKYEIVYKFIKDLTYFN